MPNIIGFLIVAVAVIAGMKSGMAFNPLLEAGIVAVTGYILSTGANNKHISAIFGFIAAGMLFGSDCLGLVDARFIDTAAVLERLCMMLLTAQTVRYAVSGSSPGMFVRRFGTGAVAALATAVLTAGFIAPLPLPVNIKVASALFAATLSPVTVHSLRDADPVTGDRAAVASGGFVAAVVLWGVATSFFGPSGTDKLRIAAMPVILGLTSLAAGFAWEYAGDTVFRYKSTGTDTLQRLTLVFLILPCARIFGLDYIFLAAGMGAYSGMMKERPSEDNRLDLFAGIVVFGMFGLKLPVAKTLLFGAEAWTFVLVLAAAVLFTRTVTISLASRFVARKAERWTNVRFLTISGPCAMILIERFIPGFGIEHAGKYDIPGIIAMFAAVMSITVAVAAFSQWLVSLQRPHGN